uniref:Uncharacterized protein n=1 Tax=viral metagenome TaxID=1070528 RepID=A0A6C0BLN5_9ZZZZ
MAASSSLCEQSLQDHYYKVAHWQGDHRHWYACLGEIPAAIDQILKPFNGHRGLLTTQLLTHDQVTQVSQYFGVVMTSSDQLMTLLGWDQVTSGDEWSYWSWLIETDDNVFQIKNKVACELKVAPEFLYAYIEDATTHQLTTVDHTFTSNDVTLDIPAEPTIQAGIFQQMYVEPFKNENEADRPQIQDLTSWFLSDYPIKQETLYLIDVCQWIQWALQIKVIPSANPNLPGLKAYLSIYWPRIKNLSDVIMTCRLVPPSTETCRMVEQDRQIIRHIKHPSPLLSENPTQFQPCKLLEIVLHINYNESSDDFIDLVKIFDRYVLNQEVPFVKYKAEKSKDPIHKVYQQVTQEIPLKMIQEWIGDFQKKSKLVDQEGAEGKRDYVITSGRGLSYKLLLYGDGSGATGPNKYATVNFYKDGKIEFKCYWSESMGAMMPHVEQALKKLADMVKTINQIEYQMTNVSRQRRIRLPDPEFLLHGGTSNTQIGYLNIVLPFTSSLKIDFNQLNQYAKQIPTFVKIVEKEKPLIPLSLPTVTKEDLTSSHLRYIRISNLLDLNEIQQFIYNACREIERGSERKEKIVKLLTSRYPYTNEEAKLVCHENAEMIEQTLKDTEQTGRRKTKVKGLGIDLKIYASKSEYKIFILGAKNLSQLTSIRRFIETMIKMFMLRDRVELFPSKQEKNLLSGVAPALAPAGKKVDPFAALRAKIAIPSTSQPQPQVQPPVQPEVKPPTQFPVQPQVSPVSPGGVVGAPRKPQSTSYLKETAPLARLKAADIIFEDDYSRKCQSQTQPIVMSDDARDAQISQLNAEKAQFSGIPPSQLTSVQSARLNTIQGILDLYQKGLMYRNHFYVCPSFFDYTTQEVITEDEANMREKSGHVVRRLTKQGTSKDYVGFIKNKVTITEDGVTKQVSRPCCYARPPKNLGEAEGVESLDSSVLVTTPAMVPVASAVDLGNQKYVLNADKENIDAERYAILPEVFNNLFNQGRRLDSKIGMGYNGYLRQGVTHVQHHQVFFNAIGKIYVPPGTNTITPKDGATIRQLLASENLLTMQRFLSLKSGALKLVFQEDLNASDQQAYDQFQAFLKGDNYLDEDILWDYVSAPGVIQPNGFNLYIIESGRNDVKYPFDDLTLKCPMGYEIEDLYKLDKVSYVLLKYGETYEIITRVDNDTRSNMLFLPFDPIMKQFATLIKHCQPTPFIFTSQLFEDSNMAMPGNLREPTTLKNTLAELQDYLRKYPDDISFKPSAQIVDAYNKATDVVLTNGLRIPIQPSSRDTELAVVSTVDVPPLSYYQTVTWLYQLNDRTGLPLEPVRNILDQKGQITGLLLKNGLVMQVQLLNPSQIDQSQFNPLIVQVPFNLDSMTQLYVRDLVDQSLAQSPNADARIKYVKRRKYEDESYQRFRYEVGNWLAKTSADDMLNQIRQIIDSRDTTTENKRQQLSQVLQPLREIVTQQRTPPVQYETYVIPNTRATCESRVTDNAADPATQCHQDPHCAWEPQSKRCRLYVNPDNLLDPEIDEFERFMALLIEELLKSQIKRQELLTNQVDNMVDHDIFEQHDQEVLLTNLNPLQQKAKISQLYVKGVDYYTRMAKLYDLQNPSPMEETEAEAGVDLYTQTIGFEKPIRFWANQLGERFLVRQDDETPDSLLEGIVLALNQRDPQQAYSVGVLRQTLANAITQIPDEVTQAPQTTLPGWQRLLRYYRDICHEDLKFDTLDSLQEYLQSPRHWICLIDLVMLSQLFDVKFMIMARERAIGNKTGFICLGVTPTVSNHYILLYEYNLEKYRIMGLFGVNPNLTDPKYLLTKEEIPPTVYRTWTETCQHDSKEVAQDWHDLTVFNYPMLELSQPKKLVVRRKEPTVVPKLGPSPTRPPPIPSPIPPPRPLPLPLPLPLPPPPLSMPVTTEEIPSLHIQQIEEEDFIPPQSPPSPLPPLMPSVPKPLKKIIIKRIKPPEPEPPEPPEPEVKPPEPEVKPLRKIIVKLEPEVKPQPPLPPKPEVKPLRKIIVKREPEQIQSSKKITVQHVEAVPTQITIPQQPVAVTPPVPISKDQKPKCQCITNKGTQCTRYAMVGSKYCKLHSQQCKNPIS